MPVSLEQLFQPTQRSVSSPRRGRHQQGPLWPSWAVHIFQRHVCTTARRAAEGSTTSCHSRATALPSDPSTSRPCAIRCSTTTSAAYQPACCAAPAAGHICLCNGSSSAHTMQHAAFDAYQSACSAGLPTYSLERQLPALDKAAGRFHGLPITMQSSS